MKTATVMAIATLATVATLPQKAAGKPVAVSIKPAIVCALKSGSIQNVVLGLNANEHCAKLACTLTQVQVVPLADATTPSWLWQGPQKSFTIAEAASFRVDAKARALAAKPAGKGLIDITYAMTGIYNLQGSYEFLGATARYGICGKKPDPSM